MPMLMLAYATSTIAPLALTAPFALIMTGLLITYWLCSRRTKPRSRRRLRRANALVLGVLVWNAFHATSLVNLDLHPDSFVISWIGVLGLTLLTMFLACLDTINNVRVYRRDRRERRCQELRMAGHR